MQMGMKNRKQTKIDEQPLRKHKLRLPLKQTNKQKNSSRSTFLAVALLFEKKRNTQPFASRDLCGMKMS